MSLAILFYFLCTQHVSEINISIIRSLRLCCWITASVVLFSVRCVLEIWCGFNLQYGHYSNPAAPNLQHTTNREQKTNVVIQQHSRNLLMMDILISETCWVHKKWNKIASDIKLVFYSSNITMMHGTINVRTTLKFVTVLLKHPVNLRKQVDANWSSKLLDVIWMVFRKYFCLLWAKLSGITGFTTLKKIARTIFVVLTATASDP